jgi:hypothetical protein
MRSGRAASSRATQLRLGRPGSGIHFESHGPSQGCLCGDWYFFALHTFNKKGIGLNTTTFSGYVQY